MDKQSYKELLSETILETTKAQKEIDRLQLLATKYMDEVSKIKRIVYQNSNNFELGKIIRNMYGIK